MAKKRHVHKDIGTAETAFPHSPTRGRTMAGAPKTVLKKGSARQRRTSTLVNAQLSTGHVKGPLKAKGKHKTSHKKTVVKA